MDNKEIIIETSKGDITIELFEKDAPETTSNFLSYIQEGFYDGTIFHRVIDNFMIQGGGYNAKMDELSTKPPIKNEATNGLKNLAYTIAMARTQEPHSATAQFFINVNNNDFLNYTSPSESGFGYCVFGKVTAGQDVVDKIKVSKTTNKGFHADVPLDDILIKSVKLVS